MVATTAAAMTVVMVLVALPLVSVGELLGWLAAMALVAVTANGNFFA